MSSDFATTSSGQVSGDSDSKPSPHLRLVAPPTLETEQKQTALRRVTAEPLDEDLRWLLLCGDSTMGARGTLAGVISQIERGSAGGTGNLDESGAYSHPFTDQQLALGSKTGIGDIERHRWLTAAWRMVQPWGQSVLIRRHHAAPAAFRSDSGFGARDKYIKVIDGASAAVAARTTSGQVDGAGAIERERAAAERRSREASHTGVEGFLGELAGLCFALCDDPARLLLACQEPEPQLHKKDGSAQVNKDGTVLINRSLQAERRKLRAEMLKLARSADSEAHQLWAEAKDRAAGARSLTERVGVRPEKTAPLSSFTMPMERPGLAMAIPHGAYAIQSRPVAKSGPTLGVDDATFGQLVRAALEESGWTPTPRKRKLVVLEMPGEEASPEPTEAGAPRAGRRGSDLLGLLLDHSKEMTAEMAGEDL